VHDPASSLRTGDIVAVSAGWRTSKHVHHVVDYIIAPFGPPIEERPRVPSAEERIREKEDRKRSKDERRALRKAGEIVEGSEADANAVEIVDGEVIEPVAEVRKVKAVKASEVELEPKVGREEKIRPQEVKPEESTAEEVETSKKTSWWG